MSEIDRLRDHLHVRADRHAPGPDCASPEEVWAASRGDRDPARVRELLRHAETCPSCSELWSLAAEIGRDRPVITSGATTGGTSSRRAISIARWSTIAALVVAAIAIPWVLFEREVDGPPALRDAGGATIESAIPEDVTLPREEAVLRWTAVPDAASYDVEVVTESLEPVFDARGLTTNELTLPAEALGGIAPGERILWRVEAVRPDGSRSASPTFLHAVE